MNNEQLTIDSSERGKGKRRCSGMRDEDGYIVVETVGVFTLFVFFMASILALVGIVALQSRVHYAITQAAQTLSMYTYVYEITGKSGGFTGGTSIQRISQDDLENGLGAISTAVNAFSAVSPGTQGSAADAASELFRDPKNLVSMYLNDAQEPGFSEQAIRPLIGRYLRNGEMTGDQYLKSMGVAKGIKGLEILGYDYGPESSLINSDGTVSISVRYEINYSFWGLPLPFSKLRVTQSAATRAWLGGEGVRYRG